MSHCQRAHQARKKFLPIVKSMLSIGLIVQTCQGMEPIKDESQKDFLRIPNVYSSMNDEEKTFKDDLNNFFASFHYGTSIKGDGTPNEGALIFFNTILPKFGFQSGNFDVCIGSDILNQHDINLLKQMFCLQYTTYSTSIIFLNMNKKNLNLYEKFLECALLCANDMIIESATKKVQTAKDDIEKAKQSVDNILLKYPIFSEITGPDNLKGVLKSELSSTKANISYYFNSKDNETIDIILPPISYDLIGSAFTTDAFSFKKGIGTRLGEDVLKGLIKHFPGKKLNIATLYNHDFHDFSGEYDDSHYCYSKIILDPEENQLSVSIFDPGEEYADWKRYIASEVFKQKLCDEEAKDLFQSVTQQMGLKLDYSFFCLAHQIHNDHDCGRFSMVYCLNDIQGIHPLKLQPYDVYLGFKFLAEHDYDSIMLEICQKSPTFELENTIPLIADATWRKFANYMIDLLNEK